MKMQTSTGILKRCTLDCQTNETTLNSVATILGISSDDLLSYLQGFIFQSSDKIQVLLDSILKEFNTAWGFSHTAWFHLTRCLPESKFEEGLLPLNVMKDELWNLLFDICKYPLKKSEWEKFRVLFENSYSSLNSDVYRIRTTRKTQDGPFGVLIGDINFNRSIGQAHYCDEGPEFVMLISLEFKKKRGYNLISDYKAATKPCIVKFVTPDSDIEYLLSALHYLHELQQPKPVFGYEQSTSYFGMGKGILSDKIVEVNFIDESIVSEHEFWD